MNRPPETGPRVLLSYPDVGPRDFTAELVQIPRGKSVRPGDELHVLGMHVSGPINVDCAAGTARVCGSQRLGDMDFVPAGTTGSWEDDAECRILRLTLRPSLLARVAQDVAKRPAKIDIAPRLHFRDPRIEAILWAIEADLAAPFPADSLYTEHLSSALAVRLVESASGAISIADDGASSKLPPRQLAVLIDFIDANLDKRLSLAALASEVGLSVTRLKLLFRASTGSSVHQYVIRRRVEYASSLLATTTTPASEIALAAGFSHQTHMAATMRRILGLTPRQIERPAAHLRSVPR